MEFLCFFPPLSRFISRYAARFGLYPDIEIWNHVGLTGLENEAPLGAAGKPCDAFRFFLPSYASVSSDFNRASELEKTSRLYASFVFRKDSGVGGAGGAAVRKIYGHGAPRTVSGSSSRPHQCRLGGSSTPRRSEWSFPQKSLQKLKRSRLQEMEMAENAALLEAAAGPARLDPTPVGAAGKVGKGGAGKGASAAAQAAPAAARLAVLPDNAGGDGAGASSHNIQPRRSKRAEKLKARSTNCANCGAVHLTKYRGKAPLCAVCLKSEKLARSRR